MIGRRRRERARIRAQEAATAEQAVLAAQARLAAERSATSATYSEVVIARNQAAMLDPLDRSPMDTITNDQRRRLEEHMMLRRIREEEG